MSCVSAAHWNNRAVAAAGLRFVNRDSLYQPRPTSGILVAITVMNMTLAEAADSPYTAPLARRQPRPSSVRPRPYRWPAAHPGPSRRSTRSRRCRYRFGRTRYRTCARRARSTWSVRSAHAWWRCRARNDGRDVASIHNPLQFHDRRQAPVAVVREAACRIGIYNQPERGIVVIPAIETG